MASIRVAPLGRQAVPTSWPVQYAQLNMSRAPVHCCVLPSPHRSLQTPSWTTGCAWQRQERSAGRARACAPGDCAVGRKACAPRRLTHAASSARYSMEGAGGCAGGSCTAWQDAGMKAVSMRCWGRARAGTIVSRRASRTACSGQNTGMPSWYGQHNWCAPPLPAPAAQV